MSTATGGIGESVWTEEIHGRIYKEDFSEGDVPVIVGTFAQRMVTITGYAIFCISMLFSASLLVAGIVTASLLKVAPTILICLVVGGLSFYVADTYVNFSDPGTRARIRQEIHFEFEDYKLQIQEDSSSLLRSEATNFIQTVAARYGWSTLIKYRIPSPSVLTQILHFQASLLTPDEYLKLYNTIVDVIKNSDLTQAEKREFVIPTPQIFTPIWVEQIEKKVSTLEGFVQFIESVDLNLYYQAGVFSRSRKEQLKEVQTRVRKAHKEYTDSTQAERTIRDEAVASFRQKLIAVQEKAQSQYTDDPVHTELRKLRREYLKKRAYIENLMTEDPDLIKAQTQYEEKERELAVLLRRNPSRRTLEYVEKTRKTNSRTRDDIVRRVKAKFDPQKKTFAAQYENARRQAIRHLESARKKRDDLIDKGRADFDADAMEALEKYSSLTYEKRAVWTRIVQVSRLQTVRHLRSSR